MPVTFRLCPQKVLAEADFNPEGVLMLAVIIAVFFAVAVGLASSFIGGAALTWSLTWSILTFLAFQITVGLLIRKKIIKISLEIQNILTEGQKKLSRMVQNFQRKPQGGTATMQKILEKEQNAFIKSALNMVCKLAPYCKWNFMIRKQMNSMKMQFNYQLKNFEEVDSILDKCLYSDPLAVAMKMARMHTNNTPGLDKYFAKKVKKFKGEQGTILYALYSWALVKRGEIDAAIKILNQGKSATGNEVLEQNWMQLVNGKVKKFSNAGLGEQWYALYLEEPRQIKVTQPRWASR